MNNTRFGMEGELQAITVLRKHFTNIRKQAHLAPFDYTAIDKLTGERVAIEVKRIRKEKGKLVHIENGAFGRKLAFIVKTNRKGIVLLAITNGETHYYLAKLQPHISKGALVEL